MSVSLRSRCGAIVVLSLIAAGLIAGVVRRPAAAGPKPGRTTATESAAANSNDPLAIFQRRILPILNSKRDSSCTECHLSGVDLKDYIHSDQATTFAALRKGGLIDVKAPAKSKILTFIARKPDKPNPISEKVRRQELAAFKAWIEAAVKDLKLLTASADEKLLGTKLPPEVIRHARKDRVMSLFVDNVWSQIGRCISCHSPARNARLVKRFGERVSWVVPHDPQATLKNLVDAGNIDLEHPENSPMLTKPAGLEKHGGGPKFLVGGQAYRLFLAFLKDYAAVVNGKYRKKADLPAPPGELVLLGRQFLRIHGIPEQWHRLPMRVDIHRWDAKNRRWSADRWATAFGPIAGKRRMWQNIFAVTAKPGSERAKRIRKEPLLPPGRYLAKLYVDFEKHTEKDPQYELGEKEFIGQIELAPGRWQTGFRTPKTAQAPKSIRDRVQRD